MLLFTFFVFRILNFPFMYWIYGRSVGLSVWQVPPTLAPKCNIISGLIFLFQCWWFYLILQAGSRMLTKRAAGKSPSVDSMNNGSSHKSNWKLKRLCLWWRDFGVGRCWNIQVTQRTPAEHFFWLLQRTALRIIVTVFLCVERVCLLTLSWKYVLHAKITFMTCFTHFSKTTASRQVSF